MDRTVFTQKWQHYFHEIAVSVSRMSPCLSRAVGAVLVTDERQIISTGYNGPPRGVTHCGIERTKLDAMLKPYQDDLMVDKCPRQVLNFRSGEALSMCPAAHAERNALVQAAKHGIATNNSTLFLTCGVPCKDCLIEIINAGIKTVFVANAQYYDQLSEYLISESGLKIRQYEI